MKHLASLEIFKEDDLYRIKFEPRDENLTVTELVDALVWFIATQGDEHTDVWDDSILTFIEEITSDLQFYLNEMQQGGIGKASVQ